MGAAGARGRCAQSGIDRPRPGRGAAGVERRDDRIRLGAGTTFQQFLEDPFLRIHLPVMPKCAIWFADDQIRQQATLAGNLVNASPAADGTPPMVAMDGAVTLVSRRNGTIGQRELPLSEFVIGPAETALQAGEILATVECARSTATAARSRRSGIAARS